MAYYKDLRQYLKALEDKGKLIRIKRLLNKDTELQPLVRVQYRGLPPEERKAFLFENVTDSKGRKYNIPVVLGALAANREIYAFGMGCDLDRIHDVWAKVQSNPIEPVVVSSGPVQEEVHMGESLLEHGGLDEFPITISTPGYDAGPYITSPYWVSKDPETGIPNLGTYRAHVKSPTRTGIYMSSANKHLARHMQKLKKAGKSYLDAAIVIGGPPSLGYVSVTAIPFQLSEFAVAGAIAGEPLELVQCRTVDLEVPAYAEIVIEGKIPINETEPEGPFGEALGFVGHRGYAPYFNVTGITHRRRPIYQGFFSQFPPSESSVIRGTGREGALYKYLKTDCGHSWVAKVACLEPTGSTGLIAIEVTKTEQANIWKTLEEAEKWVAGNSASTKMLVAVDSDINIRDADSITWALSFRMQPHRDCRIVPGTTKAFTDHSVVAPEDLAKGNIGDRNVLVYSRLLLNATLKWPYPPISLPKKEFMERALQIWKEEKLPPVKLQEPWCGYSLGFWTDEEEQDAALAIRGDYQAVGDKLAKRRKKV